jgi:hypothetical protein
MTHKQQMTLRNKFTTVKKNCIGEILYQEGEVHKRYFFRNGIKDTRFADYLVVQHQDGNILSLTKLR